VIGAARRSHLLNVDLEVRSVTSLAPLAKGFGDGIVVLFEGADGRSHRLSAELVDLRHRTADRMIAAFVKLILSLPHEASRHWFAATSRAFDIGIQSGIDGPYSLSIRPTTIAAVVAVRASITVTTYPAAATS
jgi:hypothetical protein